MKEQPAHESVRIVARLLVVLVLLPMLPLFVSWHWAWWQAWVYLFLAIAGFAVSRAIAARRNPDLLSERARSFEHENVKPWDRVLAPLVGIGGALVPLVAGLDARFGWSAPFSVWVTALALAVVIAGYGIASWALIENRFFSGVVRIQLERGHHVVSSGPYAAVRHPGYAGGLLSYLAIPFLLDSWWALVPAVLLMGALVVRTRLEDAVLREELPGYADYARRVRYRLVPGVW